MNEETENVFLERERVGGKKKETEMEDLMREKRKGSKGVEGRRCMGERRERRDILGFYGQQMFFLSFSFFYSTFSTFHFILFYFICNKKIIKYIFVWYKGQEVYSCILMLC